MAARLLSLPAELRNMIYESAISPPVDQDWQDLRLANIAVAPSVLVNKQIHAETRGMYHKACRQYWRSNHFYLDMSAVQESDETILKSKPLSLIQHLDLLLQVTWTLESKRGVIHRVRLVDPLGTWTREGHVYHEIQDGFSRWIFTGYFVMGTSGTEHTFDSMERAREYHEHSTSRLSMIEQILSVMEMQRGRTETSGFETLPFVPNERVRMNIAVW